MLYVQTSVEGLGKKLTRLYNRLLYTVLYPALHKHMIDKYPRGARK